MYMDICRYGFDEKRCVSSLEQTEGDIGQALELLLSDCFNLGLTLDTGNDLDPQDIDYFEDEEDEHVDNGDVDDDEDKALWEDIYEQRIEETTTLTSIYGDMFVERIPNKVWVMALELPHLTEIYMSKREEKERMTTIKETTKKLVKNTNICNFYQQGNCRFGNRCKYKHDVAYREVEQVKAQEREADVDKYPFQIEVRFPHRNKYPLEPPYVAFSTTSVFVPKTVCLNITSRLLREAQDPANAEMPVFFTLVSILENEPEVIQLCFEEPLPFSLPEPIISRKMASVIKTIEPLVKHKAKGPGEVKSFGDLLDQVGPEKKLSYQGK